MDFARLTVLLGTLAAFTGHASAQEPSTESGRRVAQDRLSSAKTLYLNAAYDEALKVLDEAVAAGGPTKGSGAADLHHYRALCLIALGRTIEAERAIASSVEADPFAVPDTSELAPRVALVFSSTRARLIPEVARRVLAEGRQLMQGGDAAAANARFESVNRLLSEPGLAGRTDLTDLSLAAGAFAELTRAQLAAAEAAEAKSAAPAGASPQIDAAASGGGGAAAAPVIEPAVVINQTLPPWQPPNPAVARLGLAGAVRVTIDVTGHVTEAVMEKPVYPPYDRLVLEAARTWLYRPALRDGQPITSDRIIEIQLKAREN